LRTSDVHAGQDLSRYSTTVTLAPSRFHTEPSQSPMTPPPITTSAGPWAAPARRWIDHACWSISTPGERVTERPVAMTMFLAV
jgi:hypothetical protein